MPAAHGQPERIRDDPRPRRGGFRIGPADTNVPVARRYLPGTMVLETSWEEDGGWIIVRERLLGYASSLGLYGEEIDARTGRHLGNFPQAFTHLALINAVMHVIRADAVLDERRSLVATRVRERT